MGEPISLATSTALENVGGTWDFSCTVCGQQNTRGAACHLPSAKHWKCLGNKCNWTPPPLEQANATDSGYWQRISTPKRGFYLFNHLTGAQGFEDEIGSLSETVTSPVAAEPEG